MIFLQFAYYTFLVVVGFQILYFLYFFSKFAFAKPSKVANKQSPVSILICAKNEAENLKNYLPFIINQEFSEFEIVLINDASYDNTLEVMQDFAAQHKNIKIVDVANNEAFWGNKKYALTLGIKAAKHNLLLFTDADCKPNSTYWLKEMSSHFSQNHNIVLGYGAYAKINNSLLNKLIRFETVLTALQYFSFAKSGIPFMGVGRNLAYTKDTFFNANGFQNHLHIQSGDDDLFINQVATKHNTALCFTSNSFTVSNPKTTFKDWIKQKRRHVSTAKHYKFLHKTLLALFYISQILFWVLAIVLLSFLFNWQIVASCIAARFLVFYIFLGKTTNKLKEPELIYLAPLLELFLIGVQLVIFIANLISKPKHWK